MNRCTGKCNQGRDCTCFRDVNLFWDVIEGLVTLCALIGIIAVMCFAFGFYWYAP